MASEPPTSSLDTQPAPAEAAPTDPSLPAKTNGTGRWVLAFVLLVAVVGGYILWTHQGLEARGGLKTTMACTSAGCGHTELRNLEAGQTLPLTCPACGKSTLHRAYKCPNCSLPHVLNEDTGQPGPTRCGKCGTEIKYGE